LITRSYSRKQNYLGLPGSINIDVINSSLTDGSAPKQIVYDDASIYMSLVDGPLIGSNLVHTPPSLPKVVLGLKVEKPRPSHVYHVIAI
jgi:hypothetical protein